MSLEFNKIAASVLTAGIAFLGAGILAEQAVYAPRLQTAAISTGGAPQAAAPAAAAPAAAPALPSVLPLLASARADEGRSLAQRQCASCHSFNEGGRNGVGPNLWGIVGANHAAVAGFNYSAANRAMASKPWTDEDLNAFLAAPARYMPGTRMAFAGINSAEQRAHIVAFLRSVSPNAPAPR